MGHFYPKPTDRIPEFPKNPGSAPVFSPSDHAKLPCMHVSRPIREASITTTPCQLFIRVERLSFIDTNLRRQKQARYHFFASIRRRDTYYQLLIGACSFLNQAAVTFQFQYCSRAFPHAHKIMSAGNGVDKFLMHRSLYRRPPATAERYGGLQ